MDTLNAIFAVGVVVNVIKGIELCLRPGQHRNVQAFVATLIHKLESFRPLEWIAVLSAPRGQRWLLIAAVSETTAVLVLLAIPSLLSGDFDTLRRTGAILTAAAVAASVLAVPAARSLAHSRMTRWLAGDLRALGFFVRLTGVALAGLAGFVVYKIALDALAALAGSSDPYAGMSRPLGEADIGTFIVGLGLLAAWPPCMYLFVLGQAGALVLGLTWLARFGAVFLRSGRALTGFVVQYNKGAWAAACLVATVALGIRAIALPLG